MLIVSDSGPLRYLIEVEAIHLLPTLYGSIATTPTVIAELSASHFPAQVRSWASQPPQWLQVVEPIQLGFLEQLDPGEASALSLAVERQADAVLIDERDGTHIARANGLKTIGTLAVMIQAGHSGLLNFHNTIHRLTHETQFHHSQKLIDKIVADFDNQEPRQGTKLPPHPT